MSVVGYLVLTGAWNSALPDGLIQANGRIREVLVREGATVTANQVLVRLDDSQTTARVQQAKHAAEALEAQVEAAHTQLAVLNLEVPLSIEAAYAQTARAKALWDKAIAVEKEARSDAERNSWIPAIRTVRWNCR